MNKPDLHFIVDEDFNLFDLSHPINSDRIKPLIFIHSSYRKSTPTKAWNYFDHRYFNYDHSENRQKVELGKGKKGIVAATIHEVCEFESNGIKVYLECMESWGLVGLTSSGSVMILANIRDKIGDERKFRFQQFEKGRKSFVQVFSYLRELKIVNSHKEALKNDEFKHLRV
ncbi:hypothetical protein ACPUEN_11675 [Algoriphagus yeomjeoni]|uniref:hypothetical protein n=1 Tax=Algoriphagus yeomjeoni TaxID=291403 RepID=UPI003CE53728